MTHVDLFSGIGGFALAAREAGFETLGFCESDEQCREFIARTWGIHVHPDIRQLDGSAYRGTTLLTGGPPCQPASRAGDQRGEGDDRWLWGEALRVLAEVRPACVVFENPPGILDVGIDGILSEMGRIGYEVQPWDIPACAVDSPQLRHRIWIVGFMGDTGSQHGQRRKDDYRNPGRQETSQSEFSGSFNLGDSPGGGLGTDGGASGRGRHADQPGQKHLADPAKPGREGTDAERRSDGRAAQRGEIDVGVSDSAGREPRNQTAASSRHGHPAIPAGAWSNYVWVPCADGKLRRSPDDSVSLVDGLHRSLLGALGNSICPKVAVEILRAVRQTLDET